MSLLSLLTSTQIYIHNERHIYTYIHPYNTLGFLAPTPWPETVCKSLFSLSTHRLTYWAVMLWALLLSPKRPTNIINNTHIYPPTHHTLFTWISNINIPISWNTAQTFSVTGVITTQTHSTLPTTLLHIHPTHTSHPHHWDFPHKHIYLLK